jgi:hypothetical protein
MFQLGGGEVTSELRLDPSNPDPASEGTRLLYFPPYAYFPQAGCYEMRAASAEEDWTLSFGFGN